MIDPRHHGDDHANRPPDRDHDGRALPQRPWQDRYGRSLPPDRDHIGRIDRDDWRRDMRGIQDRWDRNDHDYHWYDWGGTRVCHRYDDYGYHWWGFYIGSVYFWTRYYDDMYWWYDPYWHRWTYLRDGRWWWQDGGVVYVIIDGNYYRYGDDGGTIVVTPDPAPPVEVPPAPSNPVPAPEQTMFYSEDGTRSVQILGDRKEAFLYDLTIEDQNDRAARGRRLGAGVKSAAFVYDDKTDADGNAYKAVRQIALTFDEAGKTAVADLNGEREVVVSGDARSAYLYNLKDDSIDPAFLADGVTGVTVINEEHAGADGKTSTRSKVFVVSAEDANGTESALMFDRNGAPYDPAAEQPADPAPEAPSAPTLMKMKKVQESPTLKALRAGFAW